MLPSWPPEWCDKPCNTGTDFISNDIERLGNIIIMQEEFYKATEADSHCSIPKGSQKG